MKEQEQEQEQEQGHSFQGSCRVEHLFAYEYPKCKKLLPVRREGNENLLLTTRTPARGLVVTNVAHFADIGLEVEDSVASHVVIPPRWAKYALGRTGPAVRSLGARA